MPLRALTPDELARSWRATSLALVLALAWVLLLYRESALAMVAIWARSDTFAHAFVVPPIVLWLVWRRRAQLVQMAPRAAFPVLFAVAGAALLWWLGELAAVNALTQLALTALLVLTVPALLGLQVARAIAFPLGFLFFAVPMGEFLLPQLMQWTADFTVAALRISGIPVYREGLQFVIPSGNWSVVDACSGIRYLIASLTVGTLFAYLNYQSSRRRVLFMLVSLFVPVAANWIRAYLIVIIGHLSGNRLAAGVDHLIYGWLFFGVVITLMFAIGAHWAEPDSPAATGALGLARPRTSHSATRLWLTTAGLALVVALPALVGWLVVPVVPTGPMMLATPQRLGSDWLADAASPMDFKPAFQNPSAEVHRVYSRSGRSVGLYLGYYRNQDYKRKLVSSDNRLVAASDTNWSTAHSGSSDVLFGSNKLSTRSAELGHPSQSGLQQSGRLMAWQIYWISGTLTSSDYLAKAYSVWSRLTGRRDDSAVLVFYAEKDQEGGAAAALEAFVRDSYTELDALLSAAMVRP